MEPMLGLRWLPKRVASTTLANSLLTQVAMHTLDQTLDRQAATLGVGRYFYPARALGRSVRMLLAWSFGCLVITLVILMEGLLLMLLSMATFINRMLTELAAHVRMSKP